MPNHKQGGLQAAQREMPEVNQIELHCWLQQRKTVETCRELGIAVMAYSPLARQQMFGKSKLRKSHWNSD